MTECVSAWCTLLLQIHEFKDAVEFLNHFLGQLKEEFDSAVNELPRENVEKAGITNATLESFGFMRNYVRQCDGSVFCTPLFFLPEYFGGMVLSVERVRLYVRGLKTF